MIVGIIGNKFVGKTTVANYLVSKHNFIEKPFSECVKTICKTLFYLSDEQLHDPILKETPDNRWYNITPRQMMQFIGTDLLRNNFHKLMPELDKGIFVRNLEIWYENAIKENPKIKVLISDVRNQNEVDFIKKYGGIIIKLIRPNIILNDMHESETKINDVERFDINHTIINDTDIDNLYQQFDSYLDKIDN